MSDERLSVDGLPLNLVRHRPALCAAAGASTTWRSHIRTMRAILVFGFSAAVSIFPNAAGASDKAFTGVFDGTGRACSGTLRVQTTTIAWRSSFSTCTPTHYKVLERSADGAPDRIVFRRQKRSSQCRYPVIEAARVSEYNWNVTGYQSLEGFQKKDLPDWSNSPLSGRQVLSCPMTKIR